MPGFESIGEDGSLQPLDDSFADSIGSGFDAGKIAVAQIDMANVASALDTVSMVAGLDIASLPDTSALFPVQQAVKAFAGLDTASLLNTSALFPAQQTAKAFAGLDTASLPDTSALFPAQQAVKMVAGLDTSTLFPVQQMAKAFAGLDTASLLNTSALFPAQQVVKMVAGLDIASLLDSSALSLTQQMAKAFAGLDTASLLNTSALFPAQQVVKMVAGLDIASLLDSSALFPAIELEQLLRNSSYLRKVDHSVATLDREQVRQLWGLYIYMQVLILCGLLVLFATTKLGTTENDFLTVFTVTTGVSGMSVASKARKMADDNFDKLFPPGRKIPDIINLMI